MMTNVVNGFMKQLLCWVTGDGRHPGLFRVDVIIISAGVSFGLGEIFVLGLSGQDCESDSG